jgi:uncharacterized protein YgbK (DUF1537 family)
LVFKKIDSTLRGNLGPEIEATMEACGFSLAVICPAFPAMGRTMKDGWLRIADRSSPALHLPTLLFERGLERGHHLDLDVVRAGNEAISNRLNVLAAARPSAVVADAVTDGDLLTIARAIVTLEGKALGVGSAGLAAALAETLASPHGDRRTDAPRRPAYTAGSTSVVLFIGSRSPVTDAQVELLVSRRPAVRLRCEESRLSELPGAVDSGRHVVLQVDLSKGASRLGELCQMVSKVRPHGLVFTGGDTAQLVCDALGSFGLALDRELAPGIPLGYLLGGIVDGCPVVTKAGGFGAPDALVAAVDCLSPAQALINNERQ